MMYLTINEIILRIFVGFILSGIIGIEREGINRPAGLRTHILVGTGSTLIMITGIFLAETYPDTDAARLGAQVVSGIGFLGAGTIIKEGVSVRGLTTAASLGNCRYWISLWSRFFTTCCIYYSNSNVFSYILSKIESRIN